MYSVTFMARTGMLSRMVSIEVVAIIIIIKIVISSDINTDTMGMVIE